MQHKFSSFADIERELQSRSVATKRHTHSLEHMHELLEFLGNPEKHLRVIHIAGTSGKTSTAYYVAALLEGSGTKVGLTVSPHIDAVNERVQIGLVPLPEDEFCRRFNEFFKIIQGCRVVPSYFEFFVSFALWEFAARKVDYAVIETGIGGLLDSTNVFDDPQKVCVITDIGFDHTHILGDTLSEIAAQKADIIQLHNTVFCNHQGPEVMGVIRAQAERKQADLHTFKSSGLGRNFDFLPLFQRRNFCLARHVARFVTERDGLPWNTESIQRAAHVYIPARMETVKLGDKTVILDIAHNGQKLHALLESVGDRYSGHPVAALVRMSARDRSMDRTTAGLKEVARGVKHMIVTSLAEEGDSLDASFDPDRLTRICHEAGFDSVEVVSDPRAAFEVLRARPEPVLLVTGSTFLLNHVRPLLADKV